MDGERFAENEIVIALGITMNGEKVLLGFVETSTENHAVFRDFINRLKDRGFGVDNEILFVIDGGKGLYKGIKTVLEERAIIQRHAVICSMRFLTILAKREQVLFR